MRRWILCIVLILTLGVIENRVTAQDQGDFRFGFRTGYYFGSKAYAVGIYGSYGIADWLNMEPGINYICKQKSSIDVYCDFQVPLEVATYWNVYPIVGLSIHDISAKNGTIDGWAGGLNIGLGTSYDISRRWRATGQVKWMGRLPVKHPNAIMLQIGIDYNF